MFRKIKQRKLKEESFSQIFDSSKEEYSLLSAGEWLIEGFSLGHPDRVADLVAEMVVENFYMLNKNAQVSVQVSLVGKNVVLFGEADVDLIKKIDYKKIALRAFEISGYQEEWRFFDDLEITNLMRGISPELKKNQSGKMLGNDLSFSRGFAVHSPNTNYLLPCYFFSRYFFNRLWRYRKYVNARIGPDGKGHFFFTKLAKGWSVKRLILNLQMSLGVNAVDLKNELWYNLVKPAAALSGVELCSVEEFRINVGGSFTIGGPVADSGQSGVKRAWDSYGFSLSLDSSMIGKDRRKVDRLSFFFARFLAVNIVKTLPLGASVWTEVSCQLGSPFLELNRLILTSPSGGRFKDLSLREKFLKKRWNISETYKKINLDNLDLIDGWKDGFFFDRR